MHARENDDLLRVRVGLRVRVSGGGPRTCTPARDEGEDLGVFSCEARRQLPVNA